MICGRGVACWPDVVTRQSDLALIGGGLCNLGYCVIWTQQQQCACDDQCCRCRRARGPYVPLAISSNDLHVFEGIRHLSAAFQAAHVCKTELVLVRPRRVRMHTVEQVSPNPSQPAHISSMRTRSVRARCRRSPQLSVGEQLAAGTLFAAVPGTPSR